MKGKVFLDSNVLLYAASSLEAFPLKYARAEEIMAIAEFGTSTQVIGEFIRNVQNPKKMKFPLTDNQVDEWVDRLYDFPVITIDREVIMSATVFQRRYQIQYWYGQIIAAAERFGANILYSEDLNDGQSYGSVRCENPFRNI